MSFSLYLSIISVPLPLPFSFILFLLFCYVECGHLSSSSRFYSLSHFSSTHPHALCPLSHTLFVSYFVSVKYTSSVCFPLQLLHTRKISLSSAINNKTNLSGNTADS
uniref:Uncharacterized protein n=1 Tax=Cacopsylla melanoneura TaxID=428564 RepID=A0A8D8TAZ8_9HEMI